MVSFWKTLLNGFIKDIGLIPAGWNRKFMIPAILINLVQPFAVIQNIRRNNPSFVRASEFIV